MHATTRNNSESVPPDGPQAPPAGHAVPAQPHAAPAASAGNSQTAAVEHNVSADSKDAKGKEEEWPEGVNPANAEHGLSAQQVIDARCPAAQKMLPLWNTAVLLSASAQLVVAITKAADVQPVASCCPVALHVLTHAELLMGR